jgi:RNA binding exosome subunit
MRKITNTEENNKYYQMVNEFIDEYINKWKINPSNLRKYFGNESKVNSFLKRYQIDDIDGIKRIFRDVLEDRENMEKDGILKFESFINEDLGNIKIDKSDINYEKVLADLYHTSVGHVDIVSQEEHKYKINDFGKEVNVVIYSKKDIEDFKKSSIPIMIEQIKDKTIDLYKVDLGLPSGKKIKCGLMFNVSDVVNDDILIEYVSKNLTEEKLIEMITHFINDYPLLKERKEYTYKSVYKEYYIWELKDKSGVIKNQS